MQKDLNMLNLRRRGKKYRRAIRAMMPRMLEALESRVLLSGNSYTVGAYQFTGGTDGATPFGGLVIDTHGNLFGTGASGGSGNVGTVFELPSGGASAVGLYSFSTASGMSPYGSLAIDAQGNLFGTTLSGGASGKGTIFAIPAGSTTPVTVYSFSGPDGANPYSGLTLDADGDMFGTTVNGGPAGHGTVFEIPSGGAFRILHSFLGPSDGANPYGPLLRDGSGNLYGTTFAGGSSGDGTVFEISGGTFSMLHSFTGADGAKPTARLVMDDAGNLFGTTYAGGANDDGTIFGIGASGGALTTLYSFTGGTDGSHPYAGLVFDGAGNLFGTAYGGGAHGHGTVFEIPSDGTVPETLYAFTGGADGAAPYGPIFVSANGLLFGTATAGGTNGQGTLFELLPTRTAQITVAQQPSAIQAGVTMLQPIVVDLELTGGQVNTADNSSVTLSIVSGPSGATLSGTTTVQASHGVATFSNLKLTHAGTYTLAASDGSLVPVALDSFAVYAGPATRLVYDQQLTGFVAGQIMAPVTVDVEDALGNVTTDNSMVTLKLASGPAGAILHGTLTVPAVNGVATFSGLSVTKTGSFTISASDGKLPVARSKAFAVSPDVASTQFIITRPPGDTIVGRKISPAVTVTMEDQFGNLIASSTTQVSSSLVVLNLGGNATAALLTGSTTVNAVKGVATLGNLTIAQPGTYALQITGGGLAAVTTNSILSYFVPTHLVFTQQPMPATAGGTVAIVVSVEDSSNRIDTTNNSQVTIALQGNATVNGTLSVQAVNGVAAFSDLTLVKAGAYKLLASDGTNKAATSKSFNITPAAASEMVCTQNVAPSYVAGAKLAPGMNFEFRDAYGNVVVNYSGTVTLAANGPGPLQGITSAAVKKGVVTFNNSKLLTAGTYTLHAGSGGFGFDSASFTVLPAAAKMLAFDQPPTTAAAGVDITPAIRVKVTDAYGNLITNSTASVMLALASGPRGGEFTNGTAGAFTSLNATAVNGVAAFSEAALTLAGSYKLKATAARLTPVTSDIFTVN
jgi:uncharacterized repeat protein (TIGR03803 family)